MAVARVGSPVVGGGSGPVSSKTFSFTATGGTNNFLVVDVGYYDVSTNATATVTYDGVAMTLIGRKAASSVTKNNSESYGLINPNPGTHNVVITFSAGGQYVACGAQEYSGVDASTPTSNVTSAEGINTTGSNSLVVTSAAGDYAHFVSIHTYGITTSSYACTNDELYTSTITESTIIGAARDAAGAATVTFAATWTTGGFGGGWSQLGFNIKANAGGGDAIAPVLTSPTGTQTGSTTGSGTVSTDEGNGTLYFWATTNATETAADIKTNGGTQTITTTGSKSVSFSGLTPSTAYYAHYVHRDAAGNDSTAVHSTSFTTTAGGGSALAIITQLLGV